MTWQTMISSKVESESNAACERGGGREMYFIWFFS